ncbi:MAG: hypothetical protein J6J21_04510 [Clostridia bacterium]|nr:hypothetical protein [Clostridia bacterium]
MNVTQNFSFLRTKKGIVAAVLAVVVILGLLVFLLADAFVPQTDKAERFDQRLYGVISDPGAGETLFYRKATPLGVAQGFLKSRQTAFGGATEAVLTESGELYLLYGGDVRHLSSQALDARLSAEGRAVVYLSSDGEVYHYTVGEEAPVLIADGISASDLSSFAVSPSGDCVFFARVNEDAGDARAFFWNGETTQLDHLTLIGGLLPLSVSDGGEHLYYLTSSETALYHATLSGSAEKLTASFSQKFGMPYFNRTVSQVLFCEGNGYTYFSEHGEEKMKVSSGVAVPVEKSGELSVRAGHCLIGSQDSLRARLYLVKREEAQTLRYLSEDFASEKYASDAAEVFLSSDGTQLYFTRLLEGRYRIYYMDLNSENPAETMLASGVTAYAFSADLKQIYYITRGNKLYERSAGVSTLISESASGVYTTPRGEVYWTVKTGEHESVLYLLKEKESVRVATKVTDFFFTEDADYVCAETDGIVRWHIRVSDDLVPLARS